MTSAVTSIVFDPAFALEWLAAGAAVFGLLIVFAAWRGLAGWALRAAAALALFTALAGPSLQHEDRAGLADILLILADESASQTLPGRAEQTDAAIAALRAQAAALGVETRLARVGDAPDNRGTRAMSAMAQALAELPRDRLGAVAVLSDGQVHDAEAAPALDAPMHLLLTGRSGDWDRRLVVTSAPAFAILGEEQIIGLRIEDEGAVPADIAPTAGLGVSLDGGPALRAELPVGQDVELPFTLEHGGTNVIHLTLDGAPGELTDRNNAAVLQVGGVRDRLRVLLVTGVPHPGTRTWRNLLKSDASVDLVHFTILRPPEKQDGVPVSELSLIAFPAQELFLDKIDEFDLIVFDRYVLRGILPGAYLASVGDYIEQGGAVLIAAGPDFASANSLARSALGAALPALPTGRVIEDGFTPAVTDLGQRHPVTRALEGFAPEGGWGRWARQVEIVPGAGQVVMSGADDAPLLALDRVGAGRVALLASDHAWLWSRGFEGGGPQLELLRRLAHWMMKEPELEEEALGAEAQGQTMVITRRSLEQGARAVTVTGPDGAEVTLPLTEESPGIHRTEWQAPLPGLYRLASDGIGAVAALGPAAPREFETPIASGSALGAAVEASGGAVMRLEDGIPYLRLVRAGRTSAGRGWVGLTPRGAYRTEALRLIPLAPAWLMLLLAAGIMVLAWVVEGRGRRAS